MLQSLGRNMIAIVLLASSVTAAERITLIVEKTLPLAAQTALDDFANAIKEKQIEVVRASTEKPDAKTQFVIGVAGESRLVDRLLKEHKIDLPAESESLCIKILPGADGTLILIAGRDARGLSYALLDLARAIELSKGEISWRDVAMDSIEKPFLPYRGVAIHPANRDLDKEWYFSEEFWRDYFKMLAQSRFNNFTLAFADQMNYLNPVYAHLVDVPGFETVKVKDVTDDGKRRNLKMLQRITELADERGVNFTFGVWTQQPVEVFGGEVTVENMPTGRRFMEYCASGLSAVLKACPSIDAVQFRMNAESGIDEAEQATYYQSQFDAIRNCGWPVRLELRYKGLKQQTIQQAVKSDLDLTVSTKFWCEHFGLPYHPTAEDTHYRESRYGFGAMLKKPRDYRVIYRLWTVGSHRLFLWGDPEYARRFAESCRLGEGEGFEIFAPLTNKGYGNAAGRWSIFADPAFKSYRWEQQRYWFYYLAFGRLGYDPQCDPKIWRREFTHRFGTAAIDIEAAYLSASRVLPLITAAKMPSASEWRWWPEMDTGGPLEDYMHAPPSDPAQFYGIRTWKKTANWWREDWDEFPPGFVEDAIAGKRSGRTTPPQVSQQLNQFAKQTLAALEQAKRQIADETDAEFRATTLDLSVQAYLAQYHAEKTLAAMHFGFFQMTNEAGRLKAAKTHMENAFAAWLRIVKATVGVYHQDLVLGHAQGTKRSRAGHHHGGHWKDRLVEIEDDLWFLEEKLKLYQAASKTYETFPAEKLPNELPRVTHAPQSAISIGNDLLIDAKVTSPDRIQTVRLYFRPLNQTIDWRHVEMKQQSDGQFEGTIRASEIPADYDLQYYFEVIGKESAVLWPRWQDRQPYYIIKVQPTTK